MSVADLIAQLEKLPPHLPVAIQRKSDAVEVSWVAFEGRYIALWHDGQAP